MLSPLGPALRDKKKIKQFRNIATVQIHLTFYILQSTIWKKVFSVALHTPLEVKTGIKSRWNASKISEILLGLIGVPDYLAKLRN